VNPRHRQAPPAPAASPRLHRVPRAHSAQRLLGLIAGSRGVSRTPCAAVRAGRCATSRGRTTSAGSAPSPANAAVKPACLPPTTSLSSRAGRDRAPPGWHAPPARLAVVDLPPHRGSADIRARGDASGSGAPLRRAVPRACSGNVAPLLLLRSSARPVIRFPSNVPLLKTA